MQIEIDIYIEIVMKKQEFAYYSLYSIGYNETYKYKQCTLSCNIALVNSLSHNILCKWCETVYIKPPQQ